MSEIGDTLDPRDALQIIVWNLQSANECRILHDALIDAVKARGL